jgi:hypothetical protein
MRRWVIRFFWLGALALLPVWFWHVLFPAPEQVIRKELLDLARTASVPPNEPQWTQVAKAHKLITFFAPDIEIHVDLPGTYQRDFTGMDDLREAALASRRLGKALTIEFYDISVDVAGDTKTATARLTAQATMQGEVNPQELRLQLRKAGRDWLIHRIDTVKTLR